MFKNDRMMLILTGLVLAIFAGSMVQYSDRILALMSGEEVVATQDDSYSVRAGSRQVLDVLSNDTVQGPIVVLSRPSCGAIEMASNNRLSFSSDAACTGAVEFAYCVDAEGTCEPNSVKINVISVSYAQESTPAATAQVPAETEQTEVATSAPAAAPAPAPTTSAPEIASFSVEMSPPALAAPSITELVSPSMAVASIRHSSGGLNSASTTDQNIATQNTAAIADTSSSSPSTFAAPGVGESNNISLGGSDRVVASNIAAPTSMQANTSGDSNIVQLERGPEALVSLRIAQVAPVAADTAPLSANPERNGDAPVFVASAQTNGPTPDSQFNATPIDGGPIALVALSRTPTRGNAAGESLNILLTEPGLQSFSIPETTPLALAPTSERPSTVSVMERGPNVEEALLAPVALSIARAAPNAPSTASDSLVGRDQLDMPAAQAGAAPFGATGSDIAASTPNQTSAPAGILRRDAVSEFISVGQISPSPNRLPTFAAPATTGALTLSSPTIDLQAAEKPPVVVASLPVTPSAPVTTAPAQNSICEISLSASVRSGANIKLDIMAACKPFQMVTVTHSGLAFSVLTGEQGEASVVFPAMETEATVSVEFLDQSTSSTEITVRDMDSVVRAGVTWQADMDLDLSAIEFGAAIGSEGHITSETPRDYRTSRIKGGGYLLQLGDPSLAGGALAEVYTIPTSRNQQRGTVAMSVVIRDVAPVCGQMISAKTVRTRDDRSASTRNVRFNVPSCSTIVSGPIALPGAINDIRVAGR